MLIISRLPVDVIALTIAEPPLNVGFSGGAADAAPL